MPKFKDRLGKEWDVDITIASYLKLKQDTPLDLDALKTDETLLARVVYEEPGAFARVMEVLLGPQVEKSGLSVEDFHDRFDAAAIDRAGDALFEAVILFTHRRRAPAILSALKKTLEAADREMLAAILDQPPSNLPANSPASVG